jgi:pSer/pThr/pTyr-binding forkhead associated (FHA) protein
MLTFTLTENGKTRTLKLSHDEITIGRSRECVVLVHNIKASRKHAKIERTGGLYQVTDLGSGNGTKVNGEKISFHTLEKGDEIRVGDAALKLVSIDDSIDLDEENAGAKTDVKLKAAPVDSGETELEVKSVAAPVAKPAAKAPAAAGFKVALKKPGAQAAKPAPGPRLKK